jgi:hypothetical protein
MLNLGSADLDKRPSGFESTRPENNYGMRFQPKFRSNQNSDLTKRNILVLRDDVSKSRTSLE